MGPINLNRLSSKLLLANLLFSLVLASVVAAVVYLGFRQTQQNAAARSVAGLAEQGRDSLHLLTEQEATFTDRQLRQAAALGRVAALYLVSMQDAGGEVPWDVNRLATAPNGQRYDSAPQRRTEVWIGPDTPLTEQVEVDLRQSAVFDALFPALMAESRDVIAIYYMSPTGVGRYYPLVDLVERLPPDFVIADQPFYALAAPAANPGQRVVWSPPYEDYVGLGPIVTASTPVYDGDTFRGVIGVDISLQQLIDRLNSLAPTEGGYAFLVDANDRIVAAPPRALDDLLGSSFEDAGPLTFTETLGIPLAQSGSPQVLAALAQMRQDRSGVVQLALGDQPVLLAHAPLPTVGWRLALVGPVEEIASRAETVADAIQQDATETVQSTLLVILVLFVVALLVIAFASRRLLVQRVEVLAAGTRAIAAGDLDVRITSQSEDELGQLAYAFNEMAGQLAAARDELEERVASRTRELAALFDVTAVASSSLDLQQVLDRSVARVVQVMNARNGTIHMLDETEELLKLAAAHNVPTALLPEIREVPVGTAVVGRVIQQGAPLYIPVIAEEPHAVPAAERALPQNSFLGAPMRAKGQMIGVLSVIGKANRQFSGEEISLIASIADQVGVAVENARLYQQAEELAVVQERQRLARELHDAVTQSVYSVLLLAGTGRRAAAAGDWEEVAGFLDRLQQIAGQALRELRLLVYELRPSALEDAGLVEALQHRLDAVEKRAGLQVQFLVEGDLWLSEAEETALYRIAVEALNNALKHAEATAVKVRLAATEEKITLKVEDNGRGFDLQAARQRGGMGLQSMRERVEQLGGDLTIEAAGEGTTVVVQLSDSNVEARNE